MYLPPPRRPSAFLKGAVARLYAAAESFERGTLEMERNVRATGRVHGHGGAGPGLEALAAALRGGAGSGDGLGGSLEAGLSRDGGDEFGGVAFDASGAGPAELRAAVEGAQRYFNKVGGDLARLHEKVRRAKAEHLAALRRRGEHRDPFAEAEAAEAEYAGSRRWRRGPGSPRRRPRVCRARMRQLPPRCPRRGANPGASWRADPGATPSGGGLFGRNGRTRGCLAGVHARFVRRRGGVHRRRFIRSASAGAGGRRFIRSGFQPGAGGRRLIRSGFSPAPAGGGLFGAASSPAPAGGGLFGAASSPAPAGGGLFGAASSPAPAGGGLFGAASSPAPAGGGIRSGFQPGAGGRRPFRRRRRAATPTFGAPAAGGGAASAPAFGSPTPAAGGLFGAAATPGVFGAPATQQPRRARRR